VSPFLAGVLAIAIAAFCPFVFFAVLALRDWVLYHLAPKPAPAALEPRVWTEGDRAWSDVLHAWWMAERGRHDVQAEWDALNACEPTAAYPHPPG